MDCLQSAKPMQIKLFEIQNPNRRGTPQESRNNALPTIWFNGVPLRSEIRRKGEWIIDYYVSSEDGTVQAFNLTVEWTGKFCPRAKSEMLNEITVELKEK